MSPTNSEKKMFFKLTVHFISPVNAALPPLPPPVAITPGSTQETVDDTVCQRVRKEASKQVS